jgi:hypothetical protein
MSHLEKICHQITEEEKVRKILKEWEMVEKWTKTKRNIKWSKNRKMPFKRK